MTPHREAFSMTVRSRQVISLGDKGHATWNQLGVTQRDEWGTYINGRSICEDVVDGTRNDHPLIIYKNFTIDVKPLNGAQANSVNSRLFENFIPSHYQSLGSYSDHLPLPDVVSPETLLLANTNPSRPVISLPVSIAEFKDLPGLMKNTGETLLNKGANHFLSYQYGWLPLISDLRKSLDFQRHAGRRAKELTRLYDRGTGLKRRVFLDNRTVKDSKSNVTVDSASGNTVICRRQRSTTRVVWGTVRWLPTSPPPTSIQDLNDLAGRTVLGMNAYVNPNAKFGAVAHDLMADAWQLMPWSWMIDWFGNVGDYLDAHRNSVPAVPTRINVMTHTVTTSDFKRNGGSATWAQGGDATLVYATKRRRGYSSASLGAALPFLSGTQLAVLGALGIQRLYKR